MSEQLSGSKLHNRKKRIQAIKTHVRHIIVARVLKHPEIMPVNFRIDLENQFIELHGNPLWIFQIIDQEHLCGHPNLQMKFEHDRIQPHWLVRHCHDKLLL